MANISDAMRDTAGAVANEVRDSGSSLNDLSASIPTTMHAWRVRTEPAPIDTDPLEWVEVPVPQPAPGEVLVKVLACGVCRTDLHVSEGDLPVHLPHVTPGHEIVGRVVKVGKESSDAVGTSQADASHTSNAARSVRVGQTVGIAWLRHTCGECDFCREGKENLCQRSRYTGWDANGGYAQYAVAPADYVYPLDDLLPQGTEDDAASAYSTVDVAPLLCAGIIGYRALERTGLLDRYNRRDWSLKESETSDGPAPRQPVLGLYGFGGSAHLTAQVALALGMKVHVLTRGKAAQKLALELGCVSARGAYDDPPEKLDAAIIFAPVGAMIPVAMRALRSGGILSLAGIHMSDVPSMNYERELFHEKEIRTVESNTRQDGREFLAFAATHHLAVDAHPYPLAQGQRALQDLKAGSFAGAAVLVP
ncbi:MAG: zinc-dependent alcohol dehydrogenase family protein [Bifidobacteriaceae bacterium]|jgi:propanol-preferring alcohol dehydrogenase|nr:zinc-dependent alcohol dehydrogenase family protein [Bifidobacteriaceae bacterium]